MTARSLVPTVPAALVLAAVLVWASPRYSDWSSPEKLAAVNSALLEFPNAISKDGLSLYIQRGTGLGVGEDLWVSRRASRESPYGAPERLPEPINSSGFNERAATLSPDGHWLFFASNRTGGQGGLDLWASQRRHVHDDFGWEPPVNIGMAVNTSAAETGPTFYKDDEAGQIQMYFVSNRPGGPGVEDIYLSVWNEDGSFSVPTLVAELSSPESDQRPYVRNDGREIYMHSNRTGSLGVFDLWVATRADARDAWSTPENPASLNTAALEAAAVLSRDGETLFFGSNRPGGDAGDVYVTTRRKASRPQ
jgi:Tol biopolymer transport system component